MLQQNNRYKISSYRTVLPDIVVFRYKPNYQHSWWPICRKPETRKDFKIESVKKSYKREKQKFHEIGSTVAQTEKQ